MYTGYHFKRPSVVLRYINIYMYDLIFTRSGKGLLVGVGLLGLSKV